jgi:hypothetical protein
MTKVERLERQIAQLRALRDQSLKRNDLYNMSRCTAKIEEVERELAQAKMYEPVLLRDVLTDKGEGVKDHAYKVLLKCSLAADFVNDCAFEAKEYLATLGIRDFHFREDLVKLCELSQKVASIVLVPNDDVLNDMLTDNETFIEACHAAANAHLKERLKL